MRRSYNGVRMTDAQKRLAEENMPLVSFALMKYYDIPHGEWADMTQIGYVGLCKAAIAYQPERGAAFASYAIEKIRGEISHHYVGLAAKKRGREAVTLSLDEPLGTERHAKTLGELLADPFDMEDHVQAAELLRCIERLPQERDRLVLREKLAGKTNREIGREYGVSSSAVAIWVADARMHLRMRYCM